jgi:uncharacterized repeat protein (TIGR03803 family)
MANAAIDLLHEFAGGSNDGAYPFDSVIQDGSVLYGMTGEGGANDLGVVFSLALPSVFNDISGCVSVKGQPLTGMPVILRQRTKPDQIATTDAEGCYYFDNAVSGKAFHLSVRGGFLP